MIQDKRRIYIATNSFPVRRLDQILSLCEAWEIEGLELSNVEQYNLSLLFDRRYPNRYLLHNYFPPPDKPFLLNLASRSSLIRQKSIEHCRKAIELSSLLDCPFYSFHAGYAYDLPVDMLGDPLRQARLADQDFIDSDEVYELLSDSIRKLLSLSHYKNVKILIENHVCPSEGKQTIGKLLPMKRAEDLLKLVEDINDSNFGILIDVGHLKVSSMALEFDREAFIGSLSPYIYAFHLSDNDGQTDQHLPFDRHAWFMPLLNEFSSQTLTIEFTQVGMEQIISTRDMLLEYL